MRRPLLTRCILERAHAEGVVLTDEGATFAAEFTALMVDVAWADRVLLDAERAAMVDGLQNWTSLSPAAITLVIRTCLEAAPFSASAEQTCARARAFADDHGLGPALLLLDCMFALASAEGIVSPEELSLLGQIADALQVDAALLRRLQDRWMPTHAHGDRVIKLTGDRLRIGRDPALELHLADPEIASHHATLSFEGGAWWITAEDGPLFIESRRLEREALGPGDRVHVGRFWLRVVAERRELHVFSSTASTVLTIRNLGVEVPTPDGPRPILHDISLSVYAGELVGLIGPSGSGKTTLLTAISGVQAATNGEVLLDGEPFSNLLSANRNLIGEVPQDDIVHSTLTVQEALWYSARLRLAQDLSPDEVDREVTRVLGELDIESIAGSRIGDATLRGISGGQRKRVNLGQELLSRSTHVLFLDEPTSGLDPFSSREIVRLCRRLAHAEEAGDEPRIIFLVTHDLSDQVVEMLDQVVMLTRGGQLAFFGPPAEACAHFGVDRLEQAFAKLQVDGAAEELADAYRQSRAYRRYVQTRQKIIGLGGERAPGVPPPPPVAHGPGFLAQLSFLTRRYATVKLRDRVGMGVLLLQAPILAALMALVYPRAESGVVRLDPSAFFVLSLAMLWFGCTAGVRELISEMTIYRRERRAGLRALPYLLSKVTVLTVICAIQAALLMGVAWATLDMAGYGFSLPALYVTALLTGGVGLSIGLLVSASFSSSEAAVGSLPLILIPQIVFGGLLVTLKDMPAVAAVLSHLTVTRWSFEAMLKAGEKLPELNARFPAKDPIASAPPISSSLYHLGFRGKDPADMGHALWTLDAVLVVMAATLLLGTVLITLAREKR